MKPHRFGDSRVFHTFFLPKRERKYQRKRFRAAARTPRGHRSCSALSALEMRRRLQRCNCSSQNEALAPLPGRKTHVSAVAMLFRRSRRREHGIRRTLSLSPHRKTFAQLHNGNRAARGIPPKKFFSKCQPLYIGLFPFFYFEEIKERPSQGCEGFSPRKLRRLRWFLLKYKQNFIFSSSPMARSRGARLNSGFFILSFCRSVKESIKESASERRRPRELLASAKPGASFSGGGALTKTSHKGCCANTAEKRSHLLGKIFSPFFFFSCRKVSHLGYFVNCM